MTENCRNTEKQMQRGGSCPAEAVRKDFPILTERTAYLDNAATTQKPRCVIEAVKRFYEEENANPLRGLYELSAAATQEYEDAREAVQGFIGASFPEEIIFTRNTTESLNLIAYSWALNNLGPGDGILTSVEEHHSNLLPWQMAAKKTGASLYYLEPDREGRISGEAFRAALKPGTKLAAVTQVSNVLGAENDIRLFAEIAHEAGAVFVCDGAQSVPHMKVDVRELDVDFLAFSGHKMLGPMGIGVLYGKKALLEEMDPFLRGGEMICSVSLDGASWAQLPAKFEAGTVNAAGAAGLHAAIRYYEKLGWDRITEAERELTRYAIEGMKKIPFVKILGSPDPERHNAIVTFTVEGVHPHDIAAIMDEDHICVRAGHHCAQPLMNFLGVSSSARASFAFYNTKEEIDRFLVCLGSLRRRMGYED